MSAELLKIDPEELLEALLSGLTSAGSRVYGDLPALPKWPAISYQLQGGRRSPNYLQRDEPRFEISTWSAEWDRATARHCMREVEQILLPYGVQGYHGTVSVPSGTAYVWNVVQEGGPSYLPDPATKWSRYTSNWRIIYLND